MFSYSFSTVFIFGQTATISIRNSCSTTTSARLRCD